MYDLLGNAVGSLKIWQLHDQVRLWVVVLSNFGGPCRRKSNSRVPSTTAITHLVLPDWRTHWWWSQAVYIVRSNLC